MDGVDMVEQYGSIGYFKIVSVLRAERSKVDYDTMVKSDLSEKIKTLLQLLRDEHSFSQGQIEQVQTLLQALKRYAEADKGDTPAIFGKALDAQLSGFYPVSFDVSTEKPEVAAWISKVGILISLVFDPLAGAAGQVKPQGEVRALKDLLGDELYQAHALVTMVTTEHPCRGLPTELYVRLADVRKALVERQLDDAIQLFMECDMVPHVPSIQESVEGMFPFLQNFSAAIAQVAQKSDLGLDGVDKLVDIWTWMRVDYDRAPNHAEILNHFVLSLEVKTLQHYLQLLGDLQINGDKAFMKGTLEGFLEKSREASQYNLGLAGLQIMRYHEDISKAPQHVKDKFKQLFGEKLNAVKEAVSLAYTRAKGAVFDMSRMMNAKLYFLLTFPRLFLRNQA
jgi:hypothetical protein